MFKKSIAYAGLSVLIFAINSSMLWASDNDDGDENELIVVGLTGIGPGTGANGQVAVVNVPDGPDKMKLRINGLPAYVRISVFLSHSSVPGALPAQFIGEFTTNGKGKGKLKLKAEIINAFASANQNIADSQGIANIQGAGAIAAGANTIPLNYFRGYFVGDTGGNVFGTREDVLGGAIAFVSDSNLP